MSLGLATGNDAGVADGAARALATVRQVLPSHLRHRVDAIDVTALDRGPAVDPAVIVLVSAAIRDRAVLRFDYDGTSSPDTPVRRTEPLHLVRRRSRWYVVGWDLDRDAWRTYRLDRMRLRTPHGPRFTPRELPAPDVATFVAARFKGSDGADTWPCRGSVVLRAPLAEVAPYVGDGGVEAVDDASCRVTLGAWSWVGLAAGLGRFDVDIDGVEPPELADAFEVLARRYAAAAGSSHRLEG